MKLTRNGLYILNSKRQPVPEPDVLKWGRWFEYHRDDRIVKQETVNGKYVSTVFLGMDHQWGGGPPLLWESMVFNDKKIGQDLDCDRCSGNWEQAEAMHEKMVRKVKGQLWKTKTKN